MEYVCSHCPLRFHQSEDLLKHFISTHMTGSGRNRQPDLHKRDRDSSPTLQDSCDVLVVDCDSDRSKGRNGGEDENCCRDCGKRFATRGNLDRHAELHRGVTYPCVLCGKVYSQKYAWGQHMKAMHQGWRERNEDGSSCEKCPYCADEFPSKEAIKQHLKAVHCMSPE